MKTKILILITLLCSVAWGANKYTVGAGGTYTYMSEAATASAAGDTILVVGRVPHNNVRADLKTNTVIRSADMDCLDTFYVGNTDGMYITTGCKIKGITIAFFDSIKSSSRQLFNTSGSQYGISVDSCVISKGVGSATNRSGGRVDNSTTNQTIRFTNTIFDSIGFGYTEKRKYFYNCTFTYGRPTVNGNDSLMYCSISATGELALKDDSVYIDHCYIRTTSEAVTLDDVTTRSKNVVITNCVIDSNGHVGFCPDGADSLIFRKNRITRYWGGNGMNYGHNNGAVDSISKLLYENCSFWGNGVINNFIFGRPNNSGVRISKCAVFRGAFGTVKSTEDTLDTLLSTATAYSDSFDVFLDTLLTADPFTEVTDSIYMYNRHRGRGVRSNGQYSGWAKYLLNEKDTIRISATEMSMSCSTDVEYWFKDPILKDSLMCILDITQDTINGPWSSVDSIVIRADSVRTLRTGSVASGQWFYRFRSHETNSYAVKDTTLYLTFTNSATAPIITVEPTSQTVDENHEVTFTLTATGAETRQWVRNSANVGTNSESYAFTAVLADDGDSVWCIVSNGFGADTSDTVFLTVNDTIIPPDPPVVTTGPVSDTTTGPVRMFAEWTGDNVQVAWYRFHGSDTILLSQDSVLQFTATPAMHGDSIAVVAWNTVDTVMSSKAGIYVVCAVFDSVNTGDSNTIYVHGNFLSGSGWTATLSDSNLTTESGSATNQVFGYNHKVVLTENIYELIITNGDYTVTLYIGRRNIIISNKLRLSVDFGF